MKKTAQLYRHGKFVRDLDPDSKYVAADGESITFGGIQFMDSMDPHQRAMLQDAATPSAPLHAPGYVSMADTEYQRRETMIADGKARLSSAWKDPPALDPVLTGVKSATITQPSTGDAADSAWERRNAALERAYLGA